MSRLIATTRSQFTAIPYHHARAESSNRRSTVNVSLREPDPSYPKERVL
jgi:hypothetical protein